jgi:gliding motility-associated-like protein
MNKYLYFICLLLICSNIYSQNGCTTLGQSPNTAFPICGTTILSQSSVPACAGRAIPVPACSDPLGTYIDVRPFWYKFTAFSGGTLGFLIQPNSNNDDYDWQIFDITGKTPADVYTDASLFVSCNWSSNGPLTGANSTGTRLNNCQGPATSNISSMPTLVKDHIYLMLVSNFSPSQAGYKLSFGGGTANITDTITPKFASAKVACDGITVSIKLNKKMKCISFAANGSDFSVNNGTIGIASAVGVNCSTGFDMDSIVLTLNTALLVGYANIAAKNGSDGNTILDNCDNGIAVGDTIGFVVNSILPALLARVDNASCASNQIVVRFTDSIRCNSIASNGSDFIVTGPSNLTIINAISGPCNANGLTDVVSLTFSSANRPAGVYTITIKNGSDNNTFFTKCNKETPIGNSIAFTTFPAVSAQFNYTVNFGCVNDTIRFAHTPNGNVYKWNWDFGNGQSSTIQNPTIIVPNKGSLPVYLYVGNGVCNADFRDTVLLNFDMVKASFSVPSPICPTNNWSITNNSSGKITSYTWDFGNGTTSTQQNPPSFAYTPSILQKTYPIQLVVANALGCKDTTLQNIIVKASLPATLDSITKAACKPQDIVVHFSTTIRCNTIAADGSDFTITNPTPITITKATATCNNVGYTSAITLSLSQPIYTTGNYTLTLQQGTDGNTILNDCDVATAAGSSLTFTTIDTVSAKFTTTTTLGCSNDVIQFANEGKIGITKWKWNFGDSRTATVQNPTMVFPTAGNFLVTLNVSNGGCTDTFAMPIVLTFDSVKAAFEVSEYICPTDNWLIINNSTGKIQTYNWDFGNGTRSNNQNPTNIVYPTPTTEQKKYPIRLTVTNAIGCSNISTVVITVLKSCFIAVPSAFTPNGDGLNDFLNPLNAYKADNLVFKVYNRYGNIVFATTDWTRKWDGKINGILQPTGTYVWYLTYTDRDTKKQVLQKGTTVLIR